MISKDVIKRLREELPRGSALIIQERLFDKGKAFALNTINATLDENNSRFNEEIFNEAIDYRNFLREKAKQLEKKVMS